MEIKTLAGIPIETVRTLFNEAFSDYSIPISYTSESFAIKLKAESIKFEHSAGIFVNGNLAGIILHGTDEVNGQKTVFNAGTGVIPKYRGQQYTEKMYRYILPLLKNTGYRNHQLEVLTDNMPAKTVYEKLGFITQRPLSSFKGNVVTNIPELITIAESIRPDWAVLESYRNTIPTWQNSTASIMRNTEHNSIITAHYNGQQAGYAAYDTSTGRVKQFAVKKEFRRKGIGTALFSYINAAVGSISFINYDTTDTESLAFFKAIGLEPGFELLEMKLYY